MAETSLTVICVKSPPLYDHHYVNKLYKAVRKHLSVPYHFFCLTDDSRGVKCKTKKLPQQLHGWWAKLYLFALHLEGLVLYLDLDTLITGPLDFVTGYRGDFAILRDFYRPDGYGSGVMLWNKTPRHVWDRWFDDPKIRAGGDQEWIEEQVKNADMLQDLYPRKFVSYKVDCEAGLPQDAAVLSFHGEPKPHDFAQDHWIARAWNE